MAKAIMIQGTMSDAGKSIITAGLCRIFKQDGKKVAPFKSQNMALNSFVTKEGLEMGRAQVMQAEAAGLTPIVAMNPVLLKPMSDMGAQVVVNGEVLGNMDAREYFEYKCKLIPEIMKAYKKLEEEYDIIVIEGAGSPAEINLRENDIVNMGMAKMANAPVILVGDIDRGGVFAQLYGTIALLEEEERAFVKGMIVNKFRGDESLLDPGVKMLETRMEQDGMPIPIVGVVPYFQVDLEDEDSVTERITKKNEKIEQIDIAVIRFPHLSNFTDFNMLERMSGVSLRYVCSKRELKQPDLIILPGTKNTIADLNWMRQNGLEKRIKDASCEGTILFGICGGFQMLGEKISDDAFMEAGGWITGMNLLPIETFFSTQKTRTRVNGFFEAIGGPLHSLHGAPIHGYEIHMGESRATQELGALSFVREETVQQEKKDGAWKGHIYGSYIHGIFNEGETVKRLVESLAQRKGVKLEESIIVNQDTWKESQYDLLAETIREHIDMKAIYQILEEGMDS